MLVALRVIHKSKRYKIFSTKACDAELEKGSQ